MTPNAKKNITKEPRKFSELKRLESQARKIGNDTEYLFLLLRYTGMHPRVVFPIDYKAKPQYKEYSFVKDIDQANLNIYKWDRPKKKGAKAYTTMPIHPNISFDAEKFIKDIRNRKSKYKKSTLYANRLIRELGESIGIYGLSPLSLRHSLAVELLKGGMKSKDVCDTLNIAESTLRTYGRFLPEDRHEAYNRAMGLVET